MLTSKPAPADHDIHELIKNRWSPLAIADTPLTEDDVNRLLEAARWAPSSFNEQPWRYVVGLKGSDIHEQLAECLVEGNSWAKEAPLLMLSISKTFFEHHHKPNKHHAHDTGAADLSIHLQATAMGLACHQMAGYDEAKARDFFFIGEEFEPMAMIVVGHPGKIADLSDDLQKRESADRSRLPLEELMWD